MITLRVDHLPALMEELTSKGQHCFGSVLADEAGKWVIQVRNQGEATGGRRALQGHCMTIKWTLMPIPLIPIYPFLLSSLPQLYPHGDAHAKPGFCSIFIKNMVLARGIAAVKIEG